MHLIWGSVLYPIAVAFSFLALGGCDVSWEGKTLPDDPYGWDGEGYSVQLASSRKSKELQSGFAVATRGDVYFGALHLDYQSERYVYARNWNSLEAAIAVTAAICEESAGRPCILAAVILPEALPTTTRRARGFSSQSLRQFRLLYSDVQRPGLWGAYAISPLAAQGFSAQQPTKDDAKQEALRNCNFRLEAELAQIGPIGASAARQRGFASCEVVHVTAP